jgi:pyruvate kinase
VPLASLTGQPRAIGYEPGVDAVALSFVKTAKEIEDVKKIIKTYIQEALVKDPTKKFFFPLIIAKIEREEAVQHQDSIIEVIDGLLVARGCTF